MDIVVKYWNDDDWCEHQKMIINGKELLSVHPLSEYPEDAIIGRDLISCSDVVGFMEMAYKAGKNGEEFTYLMVESKDE